MKKENKIIEGKADIPLLKSPLLVGLFDDDDGVMGIASEFTTPKRAAKYLEISMPTLRKYTKSGFLTRFSLRGRKYYRIEELELAKKNIF